MTTPTAVPAAGKTIQVPPFSGGAVLIEFWSAHDKAWADATMKFYATAEGATTAGDRAIRCGTCTAYRVFRLPGDGQPVLARLGDGMTPEQVESLRLGFHATYNGGHRDENCRGAFHHGMDTVFNSIAARVDAAAERTGVATTIRKCATCDREAIPRHTHCAHCEHMIDEARDERDAQRDEDEAAQVRRTDAATQERMR